MRLTSCLMLVLMLAVGSTTPAVAQGPWSVFMGVGAAGFGGGSEALAPAPGEPTQFKPTPTTRLHAGVSRGLGRGGITLDVSYAKSGFGGYGANVNVTFSPVLTLYDVRLLGSYALARIGTGSLRAGIGPMLQVWSGDALASTQTRLGGAASLTLTVPVSRRVGLLVSGSLAVSGSPFDEETLNLSGVTALATWTRELGIGVQFSL